MGRDDDLHRAVGRLEGKVDLILERVEDIAASQNGHHDRLTTLEHALTRLKTITAGIALVVSVAIPIILKYFNLA